MTIDWSERAANTAPARMSRSLSLELGGFDNGAYELTVSVLRGDGAQATSSRTIRIER